MLYKNSIFFINKIITKKIPQYSHNMQVYKINHIPNFNLPECHDGPAPCSLLPALCSLVPAPCSLPPQCLSSCLCSSIHHIYKIFSHWAQNEKQDQQGQAHKIYILRFSLALFSSVSLWTANLGVWSRASCNNSAPTPLIFKWRYQFNK